MKILCPMYDAGVTKAFTGTHWGVDLGWVNQINAPIIAPADAKVVDNFYSASCGYSLVLQIPVGTKHIFCTFIHLNSKSNKSIGTSVKQGEVVGYRGNTGNSNGPHLHWGMTTETDKAYTWNLVKSLAIDPMKLDLRKSKAFTYYGQMFKTMKFIDEDEDEVTKLKKQVEELTKKISDLNSKNTELNNKLTRIKEIL